MVVSAASHFPLKPSLRRFVFFFGIFVLVLIVRAQTFIAPWSDRTVGLYVHIGAEMLHGTLPYVGTWEYKPPGAFVPYALILAVTGSLTAASILAGFLAVFATAVLLFIVAERLDSANGSLVGCFAAVLYVLMSSEDDGLTGDVELFIPVFMLTALALVMPLDRSAAHRSLRRHSLVGFFAGCALQMKLTALPGVLFLFALLVGISINGRRRLRAYFAPLGMALAGFMVPIVCEIAMYAHAGHLADLYDVNVGATFRRLMFRPHEHGRGMGIVLQQFRVLAPALEVGVIGLFCGIGRKTVLIWMWFAAQSSELILAGEYDYRQFLEIMPPVALLGGFGVAAILPRIPWGAPWSRAFVGFTLLLSIGLHDYYPVMQSVRYAYHHAALHDWTWHENAVTRTARELPPLLHGDRSLFLVNESPLLYDLLQAQALTRYCFTENLLDRSKWAMLGFQGPDELRRVLAKRPHYVLLSNLGEPNLDAGALHNLRAAVLRSYRRVGEIGSGSADGEGLYQRRPDVETHPRPRYRR